MNGEKTKETLYHFSIRNKDGTERMGYDCLGFRVNLGCGGMFDNAICRFFKDLFARELESDPSTAILKMDALLDYILQGIEEIGGIEGVEMTASEPK